MVEIRKSKRSISDHPETNQAALLKKSYSFFWTKDNKKQFFIIVGILLVATFAVYVQSISYGFVRDDEPINLTQNPYLNSPSGTHILPFWKAPFGMYIPITYTVWGWLKYIGETIWGQSPPFHAPLYHLVNCVFHAGNVFLLFLLLKILIPNLWAAAAGALIFALHPMQVESVAYVSELRGLLSTSFSLISLLFYLEFIRRQEKRERFIFPYILCMLFFVLGMLSKPSVLILPILALALDLTIFRGSFKKSIIRIIPFLLIALPCAIVTKIGQPDSHLGTVLPLFQRPFVWFDSINFYLWKTLWPVSLATSYARTPEWASAQPWFYLSWTIPAVIGFILWKFRSSNSIYILAGVFFIVGFLPVSGLIPFEYQKWSTVADRYMYLPLIGIAIAFAGSIIHLKRPWNIIIPVVTILALGYQTGFVQVKTWQDELTLWNHCIKVTPEEEQAYFCVGDIYVKEKQFDVALEFYNQGLKLGEDDEGYVTRGNIFAEKKLTANAFADYQKAISMNPANANVYNNRGNLYLEMGDYQSALNDFEHAVQQNKLDPRPYIGRGNVHFKMKNYEQAIIDYTYALQLEPRTDIAYLNRGDVFLQLQRNDEAQTDYQRALALNPDLVQAHYGLARIFFIRQNYEQAVAELSCVITASPGNCFAYENRAKAYVLLQKPDLALQDIRRAQENGCQPDPSLIRALSQYTAIKQ